MQFRKLGATDLHIAPLVLGGNVFGWTADKETSFAILDAFLEAGFNAIDTADVYNRWAPGLQGGESETIIGSWMKDRGVRDRVIIITKGGLEMSDGLRGLGRKYWKRACEASLKRLQTDYIDVYMAHRSDPEVPIEETLQTAQILIEDGKIRCSGCSNYTAEELSAALACSHVRTRYGVFEPHYNLIERSKYEGASEQICEAHGLGVIAYYALASGFLAGKYRSKEDASGSPRSRALSEYLNSRGFDLLRVIDSVATHYCATPAQVALAWLMARPSITAPIASATSVGQLLEILKSADLRLTAEDLTTLSDAGRTR